MPKFAYTAKTKTGKVSRGSVEASSREEAESKLLEMDLSLLMLREKSSKSMSVSVSIPLVGGVSSTEKLFFVRHLVALIKAGISLIEALEVLSGESRSPTFRKIIKDMITTINNGSTLSNAMSRHPKVFDRLFVHIVGVGEEAGTLEENLEYVGVQLEKARDLQRKLIAAMIYPGIIFSLAIVIAAGLVIFILPRLIPVFISFNVELPLTTRILIGISTFFQESGLLFLGGVIAAIIIYRVGIMFPLIKQMVSRGVLWIPIFGPIIKNLNLAFLSRTMETLIRSGIPIGESAEIASDTLNSLAYRNKLKSFKRKIQEGRGLGIIFEGEKAFFPVTFSRMVGVGEKSGKLEDSFRYLAEFYEKEVDNLTGNLSNILQPILLITVGLVVGFVAIAIITPIYKFTDSIR